jgi:hypothetical protein
MHSFDVELEVNTSINDNYFTINNFIDYLANLRLFHNKHLKIKQYISQFVKELVIC